MSDWIGLGVIVLLVLAGIAALSFLGKPYKVTSEEFEKRAEEGMGLLGASVMGLQKIIEPQVEKAVEVMQDFRAGHYDGQQESGDDLDDESAGANDSESAGKVLSASDETESAKPADRVLNVSNVEEHDA